MTAYGRFLPIGIANDQVSASAQAKWKARSIYRSQTFWTTPSGVR